MRALALAALLLTGCSAFDRAIDMAALAGEVAVQGGYVTADEGAAIREVAEAAKTVSAVAQGKAEAAHELVKAAEEGSDLAMWLSILAGGGVLARGVPSKGPVRAIVQALTPKRSAVTTPPAGPPTA